MCPLQSVPNIPSDPPASGRASTPEAGCQGSVKTEGIELENFDLLWWCQNFQHRIVVTNMPNVQLNDPQLARSHQIRVRFVPNQAQNDQPSVPPATRGSEQPIATLSSTDILASRSNDGAVVLDIEQRERQNGV